MSDRYFVDTNILMYAHDAAAGENSEDLSDGQRYAAVRVVNPFRAGA